MRTLAAFHHDFEGKSLTTLTYKGRAAWVARHIGVALGYSHSGKRLPNRILCEWADEFEEGRDYAFLVGEDLQAFKEVTGSTETPLPTRTNHGLLILFESGLHLVLAKTHHTAGKRLRRFLADQVMPQLVRDGCFRPDREVVGDRIVDPQADGAPGEKEAPPVLIFALLPPSPPLCPDPASRREDRLGIQADTRARSVNLCDRRFRVNALYRLIAVLKHRLDTETRAALEVSACEIATGSDLSPLKGAPNGGWLPVPQIAQALGVTAQKVGRTVTILGLRRDAPGLARQGLQKSEAADRLFVTWFYSPEAVERIAKALGV